MSFGKMNALTALMSGFAVTSENNAMKNLGF
jgi:hypothetical protein